ncbi:PQQ-like beta-propeller repeat protein [Spirillospora sp. NBC_00431]
MAKLIFLLVVAGLISGCGAALDGSGAPDRSDEDTCRRPPGGDDKIRSARPTAIRFGGDRHVGRLRWVAEHEIMDSYSAVGTPRHGVVPVSGGSRPEPDYGAPTRNHMGVLRLRDGKAMWRRAGGFADPRWGADDTGDVIATWSGRAGVGAFDLRTGRTLSCGHPGSVRLLGDGTAVSSTDLALARVRLRDGTALWSRPATMSYQHVVTGDGVVAASTGVPESTGGFSGRVSVFRSSDGKPLWEADDRVVMGVSDDRVVVAGPTRLAGHRAVDGKQVWTRPFSKHDDTTFAVVDGRLLVAGRHRVTAYSMADGTVDWTAPAGETPDLSRSAASDGFLYAPVRERSALAVIDLRRGEISRSLVGVIGDTYDREVAIGDGTLVLQDRDRTLAFELRP